MNKTEAVKEYRNRILACLIFFGVLVIASVIGALGHNQAGFLRYLIILPLATDLLSMAYILGNRSGIGGASMLLYVVVAYANSQPILLAPSEITVQAVIRKMVEGVLILLFHILTNLLVPWLFAKATREV